MVYLSVWGRINVIVTSLRKTFHFKLFYNRIKTICESELELCQDTMAKEEAKRIQKRTRGGEIFEVISLFSGYALDAI